MKKYDHMVELNRQSSKEKITRAITAIANMEQKAEKISVAELVLRTELSRAFFYKNEEVRVALDAAMRRQQYEGLLVLEKLFWTRLWTRSYHSR